ncbi:MAG: c-type cytochrome [Magnetospirillum sp.]|nr:c-type cytochrome [Magnetospirillum sp.]
MKTTLLSSAFALALVVSGGAFAADGNVQAGAKLASDVCSKCHGDKGVSPSPLFPNLAGQKAGYIENELHLFRDRGRGDPHARAYMWGIAGPMTDAQISDVAAYFAAQTPVHGSPASDTALAEKGKAIFEKGVEARQIPACAACHGKNAEGNDTIPRLAGQYKDYLVTQMLEFRGLLRDNETMHENTAHMTDDDARAVAEFLSSK